MCCCKEGYKCEQAAFLGLGRGADSPEQFRFFTDFILLFAKSGYDGEGFGLTSGGELTQVDWKSLLVIAKNTSARVAKGWNGVELQHKMEMFTNGFHT
jgi:hypothetical protein